MLIIRLVAVKILRRFKMIKDIIDVKIHGYETTLRTTVI